jgi:alpha-L-arabinofuranosidase
MPEALIRVDAGSDAGRIDERIYGHFLEHIYHSVNGGLWGELVRNRSFEEPPGSSYVRDGMLYQECLGRPTVCTFFGDPSWTDVELSLEAERLEGTQGFRFAVRATSDDTFCWYKVSHIGPENRWYHVLERRTDGGSFEEVGPRHFATVETGRRYRYRLRCEGPRVRVWLDDELVTDWSGLGPRHARGRVGIGSNWAFARFRDIRVTTLDGAVLHEGPPDLPDDGCAARFWRRFGTARIERTDERPLNSSHCLLVESVGGTSGLRQGPIAAEPGNRLRGSLWMRGDFRGQVSVRLVDAGSVVAEQGLGPVGPSWEEHPLDLPPSRAAGDAEMVIEADGEGRLWIDQVSLMSDAARATGGMRPDILEAVKALRPPVIRWPGGYFAEFYRWKDAIGPQRDRKSFPISIWDDLDPNAFGTDEFMAFCRAVGAEPLLVVNVGQHDVHDDEHLAHHVREACDWLEYCNGDVSSPWGRVRAANGHPEPYGVKLWEIGNEEGRPWYLEAVRRCAAALKERDPQIAVTACDYRDDLVERCGGLVDFFSVHRYDPPDRYADGPAEFERVLAATGARIARSKHPGHRLYVSEWGALSTDWRSGLWAAGALNAFERQAATVSMAAPALFMHRRGGQSDAEWDNAFVNFDHHRWYPGANYLAMKLWRDHWQPVLLRCTCGVPWLSVAASRSLDGRTVAVKLVNTGTSDADVSVEIEGGHAPRTAEFALLDPGSLTAANSLEQSKAIDSPGPRRVTPEGRHIAIRLPARSAGVLALAAGS